MACHEGFDTGNEAKSDKGRDQRKSVTRAPSCKSRRGKAAHFRVRPKMSVALSSLHHHPVMSHN
jgi:hypothetical protein